MSHNIEFELWIQMWFNNNNNRIKGSLIKVKNIPNEKSPPRRWVKITELPRDRLR